MIRKIVHIDEEKCNGCGVACANACHEDAIAMIDGKARLIKDDYCDGLGDCLPACPMDAIKIIEREAMNMMRRLLRLGLPQKKWLRMPKRTVHLFMSVRAAWQEAYSMYRQKMLKKMTAVMQIQETATGNL